MFKQKKPVSYLLEVVVSNRFYGRRILLPSYRDAEALGLRPESVRTMQCLPNPVLKGLRISVVPFTRETIPGQQEVIDHFLRYPALYNFRHHPVIGEIMTSPFKGEHIALFTVEEIRRYFSIDAVRNAYQRSQLYAGIAWKRAETFQEAEGYYCQPGQSVILSVFRKRYKYAHCQVNTEQHRIFVTQLRQVSIGLMRWYHTHGLLGTLTHDGYRELAEWYCQLDQASQCYSQYCQVRDTLFQLQDILTKGHKAKPLLFIGHCKILERIANEIG